MTVLWLVVTLVGCAKKEQAKGPAPVTEVVAVTVQPKTVPATFPFVAQIQSSHQVDVMARVNGFLEKISYREGEPVKQGQVLFVLDKKPFIAAVDAANAAVHCQGQS
jgi:membrane fusion protein, multidrug efflux system